MKYSPFQSRSCVSCTAGLEDWLGSAAAKVVSPTSLGHLLAGPQGRQVERADERVRALVVDVVGVVLRVLDQPVGVGVLVDRILQGLLDPWPESLQERTVGRHLVFAVRLEDRAALAVGGVSVVAAKSDQPASRDGIRRRSLGG